MIVTNVVASHYAESYIGQLMRAFERGLETHVDDVLTYDLYAQSFDPVMRGNDFNQFLGGPLPDDVLAVHDRLRQSDVLTFFYPVWWYGMPAIMKGWIDRVFAKGFAYDFDENGDRGLLSISRVMLVRTLGNSQQSVEEMGLAQAMRVTANAGIFEYCGVPRVDHYDLYDVYRNHDKRARYLHDIEQLGAQLSDAKDWTP